MLARHGSSEKNPAVVVFSDQIALYVNLTR